MQLTWAESTPPSFRALKKRTFPIRPSLSSKGGRRQSPRDGSVSGVCLCGHLKAPLKRRQPLIPNPAGGPTRTRTRLHPGKPCHFYPTAQAATIVFCPLQTALSPTAPGDLSHSLAEISSRPAGTAFPTVPQFQPPIIGRHRAYCVNGF